jgi:hypothetical protein
MKKYHLIAYRPSSRELGLHDVGPWFDSDCEIHTNISEEVLIERWVLLETLKGSGIYNFQVMCEGENLNECDNSYSYNSVVSEENRQLYTRLSKTVRDKVRHIEDEKKKAASELLILVAKDRLNATEAEEKALLKKLQEKYQK